MSPDGTWRTCWTLLEMSALSGKADLGFRQRHDPKRTSASSRPVHAISELIAACAATSLRRNAGALTQ
jgi:hypothetical protein